MKLEYLVLVPNQDSFCNTQKAFMDFLKVDSLVSISGKTLSYRRTAKGKILLSTKIRVETDLIPSKDERYFLIVLEAKDDVDVDSFSELGDKVKSIAMRLNPESTIINTIWNDVGRHYSQISYPLINEIENLMRKLISKFMLINVGMNWSKDAVHPELFKKIEGYSEEELYSNDLYKLDFIHLSDVLFKKKRDITLEQLDRILSNTSFKDSDQEQILKYVPRSNWDKYFTSILDGNGNQLESQWNRLYKLRNKVAHNRFITKDEYGEIKGICNQVKQMLTTALNNLGEIDLDIEERESVVLSYQSQSPAAIGFLAEKSVAEMYMRDGYDVTNIEYQRHSPLDFIACKDNKVIGVAVSSVSARNLYPSIRFLFNGGQPAGNVRMSRPTFIERLDFDGYERVNVVYVLRNLDREGPSIRAIDRVKEIVAEADERINITFGFVNEENYFEEVELYNF